MMDNNKLARSIIENPGTSMATLQKIVDHAKQTSDHTVHRHAHNILTMRSQGWKKNNTGWYAHKKHPGHEILVNKHSWSHVVKADVPSCFFSSPGGWLHVGTSDRAGRWHRGGSVTGAPGHTINDHPEAQDLEHHLDLLKKRGVLK